MKASYDAAVIGVGTMGCFACCELARRGLRVIGFDRFAPPHGRGSHSGDTRVFRIVYAEHPDYVPLAARASELWDEYSATGKVQLLNRCGMLSIGPNDGELISGIRTSSSIHGLPVKEYSAAEIRREFPAFDPEEGHIGMFEPTAGWLDANAAIETALRLAKQCGATLSLEDPVWQWSHNGSGFEIRTTSETFFAKKLVITAGAWTTQLLEQLGLPIRVLRKVLVWVDPIEPALFQPGPFPVFGFSEGFFYGFPLHGDDGVKMAVHWRPGQPVGDPSQAVPEANLDDATEPLALAAKLMPRLAGPLPQAFQRIKKMKTCLYGMSHDEHFFIDRHPEHPDLVFAAGFSGHGFKFAPSVGEALADLLTTGTAKCPLSFLSISRVSKSAAV